jgi:peptidoglycan/xylan/chitin deacetylase (PgdA/CDA1 family)
MRTAGILGLAGRSRWRHQRLLILAYHGMSQVDEHRWNRSLFIPPALLDRRLVFLKGAGFNVLPLQESLDRLREGTLPERSVALTFDDGYVDFFRLARPVLERHHVPATVYLTTYYSERNLPVPGITAAYMVWKSAHFRGPIRSIQGFERMPMSSEAQRLEVSRVVGEYFTDERGMPPDEKQELLERLADELEFDLAEYRRRRLMHLMTPEEVREVAAAGIDIQLHTHRHWVPKDERLLRREIVENRERVQAITGRRADHLCYPSGVHFPELLPWLRALGVRSATTCEPALATAAHDPLLLPRFIDHAGVSDVEFEAWATGVLSVLPRRPAYEAVGR